MMTLWVDSSLVDALFPSSEAKEHSSSESNSAESTIQVEHTVVCVVVVCKEENGVSHFLWLAESL